uniref:Ig-like domain-containing protein n=1 Tax=Pseudonaja textilis TaxID=8673 RepID=A0A670YY60_PSETE
MPKTLMVTLNVHPLCPSLGTISSVTLVCSIYSYSLENIQVTWKPDGNFETLPKDRSKFYASSNITVSLEEWNKLKEYTCKVTQCFLTCSGEPVEEILSSSENWQIPPLTGSAPSILCLPIPS